MLATHMARHFTKTAGNQSKPSTDLAHNLGASQTTFTVRKNQAEAMMLIKNALMLQGFNVSSANALNVLQCSRRSAYMQDHDTRLEISLVALSENATQVTVRQIGGKGSLLNQRWIDRRFEKLQTLVEVAIA
ncbi:MAG: hypothetical protein ACRD3W_26640 [Terriglobales bacterium]